MIRVRNVTKGFGNAPVLTNLSFDVPEAGTVALLGLSGSGKTTALKLVCGLCFADEGTVEVNGERLRAERLPELRKQIGYVIQEGGLFPHLTVYGNVAVVGREAGYSEERIHTRLEELAEMTRLPKTLFSSYPREISGGQRQRVGMIRALFLDPPILLLDEPMGALDPITRCQLQDELKQLFQRLGKTVLLVTHDLFEASYLSDRILLLNQGRIAQSGTLDELVRNPADDFVRLFIGSQRRIGAGSEA